LVFEQAHRLDVSAASSKASFKCINLKPECLSIVVKRSWFRNNALNLFLPHPAEQLASEDGL
jgi:hypothetical protein